MSKRKRKPSRPRPTSGARPNPLTLVAPASGSGDTGNSTIGADPAPASSPNANVHQIQMLVGLIATGSLDEHLSVIQAAVSERHRVRQRAKSNQAAARIEIGDRVSLGHDIRPLYLHGATGTVTGWSGQSVVIQLDQPTGRFTTGQIRCPPLGLQRLPG